MTTQHTNEMREAFEQLWSDRYQNEETFFDQFSSPQIMKDFAKLFAYEMYQAATTRYEDALREAQKVMEKADCYECNAPYEDGCKISCVKHRNYPSAEDVLATITSLIGEKK